MKKKVIAVTDPLPPLDWHDEVERLYGPIYDAETRYGAELFRTVRLLGFSTEYMINLYLAGLRNDRDKLLAEFFHELIHRPDLQAFAAEGNWGEDVPATELKSGSDDLVQRYLAFWHKIDEVTDDSRIALDRIAARKKSQTANRTSNCKDLGEES
jgi:hypothetical protein